MKTLIKILIVWALLYLAFSVPGGSLKPFEWREIVRNLFCTSALVALIVISITDYLTPKDENY